MDFEELRQSAQRRSNLQRSLSINQANYSDVSTSLFTTEEDIKSYIKKSYSLMLSYRCNINEFVSNIIRYLQSNQLYHSDIILNDDGMNELLCIFKDNLFSTALSNYKNLLENDSLLKRRILEYQLEIYGNHRYKKWSNDEIYETSLVVSYVKARDEKHSDFVSENKKDEASEGLFTLYSCDKCNAPIKDINDFDDHYSICSKSSYNCILCGIELDSKLSLGPHLTVCPNYLVKRSAAYKDPDDFCYSDDLFIQRNSYHSDSYEEYKKSSSIEIILSSEIMMFNTCKNCSERCIDMSEHKCPYSEYDSPAFSQIVNPSEHFMRYAIDYSRDRMHYLSSSSEFDEHFLPLMEIAIQYYSFRSPINLSLDAWMNFSSRMGFSYNNLWYLLKKFIPLFNIIRGHFLSVMPYPLFLHLQLIVFEYCGLDYNPLFLYTDDGVEY